jgi:hypothetical protein
MVGFKEWLREKTEEAQHSERAQELREWHDAYQRLTDQIVAWLREDGAEYVTITPRPIERSERGLGTYELTGLQIRVGDAAVEVVPLGRNVVGHVSPGGGPGLRAAGRVDITDGTRKFPLYRTVQDGQDHWYVVDERLSVTPLTRDRLQEIIMDLMS